VRRLIDPARDEGRRRHLTAVRDLQDLMLATRHG
jgi:hypothetical protein